MLPLTLDAVRTALHVLGAAMWVGGQITLLGLLPVVRGLGPDAPRVVARRFSIVAWSGFALLVATGIWTLLVIDVGQRTTAYHVTLGVKLLVVAATAAGAVVHSVAHSHRAALAVGGAVSGLGGLVALVLGVQLGG